MGYRYNSGHNSEVYFNDGRIARFISCYDSSGNNCKAFAKKYKKLIDKSWFKDEIYKILPQPKNK